MKPDARLVLLKALHTTIWVFFAGCVVTIPVQAVLGNFDVVLLLIGVIAIEIAVLAMNNRRCPLTGLAARYTSDRRANFDIYLPEWLAGRTMVIFGPLFTGGLVLSGLLWWVSKSMRSHVDFGGETTVIAKLFAGVALVGGLASVGVLAVRRRFISHLDTLEAELRKRGPAPTGRTDLPAEVVALAVRMGARADGAVGFVEFEQSGQMWRTPGGPPSDFTARQTIRHDAPGFLWRAAMGHTVVVADYFVAGTGGLEVMLLGAVPIARIVGGTAANQGEALRYLAELPWSPDAILINRALDWTVADAKTIKVATGVGAERGEVTFELDNDGLIVRGSAPLRVYVEKGRTSALPWHGRFWDYQRVGDRLIPIRGEVAWTLDAGDFVYWRGRILVWNGSSAKDFGDRPIEMTNKPNNSSRI